MSGQKINITSVKHRSIKAMKWSVSAEVFSRIVPPLTLFILARLLSPADFGVIGIATVAIGLAQIFQEFGLGKALVQTEQNVDVYANNAFWINTGLGIATYTIIFLFAPAIAQFFHSPESTNVLRVICIQIVITGLFSTQAAWLKRNMNFKAIFLVRLFASVLPGCISVAMAFAGMGVWSLVAGSLAGAATQMVLYWKMSNWRPTFNFDLIVLKKMFLFAKWIVLEGFLAWIILSSGSIVVGRFLGVKDLGCFRLGLMLILFLSNVFMGPIVPVAFSYFSRLQSDPPELKNSYLKLTQLIGAISIPLGVAIALMAKPVVYTLLGEKWGGTEIVLAFMAIRFGVGSLMGLNSTVFVAVGRPDLSVKMLIILSIISLPAYIYTARYGLLIFCMVRLTTSIIGNVINYIIAKKILKVSDEAFLKPLLPPLAATAIMVVTVTAFMNTVNMHSIPWLILVAIAAGLTYVASLWIINRDFVSWGFNCALKMIK